jgi:hypothetical protein
MCKALELMMFNKRMYDLERVAAYVKRLLTMATGLPPHSAMAVLKVVFDLLRVRVFSPGRFSVFRFIHD